MIRVIHEHLQMRIFMHQLRSGTDIAFIGGMINYILENNFIMKNMLLTIQMLLNCYRDYSL